MDDPQGHLEKGEGGLAVETCWGGLDSKGGELNHHRAIQDHLTPQRRQQDIVGYFEAEMAWKDNKVKDNIYVIERNVEALLGRKTSFELKNKSSKD